MRHNNIIKTKARCEACRKIFTNITQQNSNKKRFCDETLCISRRDLVRIKKGKEKKNEIH
mgnify:CR=1 FL=1|jgi:rRNA maturation endonuclease Nob1